MIEKEIMAHQDREADSPLEKRKISTLKQIIAPPPTISKPEATAISPNRLMQTPWIGKRG